MFVPRLTAPLAATGTCPSADSVESSCRSCPQEPAPVLQGQSRLPVLSLPDMHTDTHTRPPPCPQLHGGFCRSCAPASSQGTSPSPSPSSPSPSPAPPALSSAWPPPFRQFHADVPQYRTMLQTLGNEGVEIYFMTANCCRGHAGIPTRATGGSQHVRAHGGSDG